MRVTFAVASKRMFRQLVVPMTEVLHRMELNRPYDARTMSNVEKFFQLDAHPNSEYKYPEKELLIEILI